MALIRGSRVEKILGGEGGIEARAHAEELRREISTATYHVEEDHARRSDVEAHRAIRAGVRDSVGKTVAEAGEVADVMTKADQRLEEGRERRLRSLMRRWRITGAASLRKRKRRMVRRQPRMVPQLLLLRLLCLRTTILI